MTLVIEQLSIDAVDAHASARWWAEVLGYVVEKDEEPDAPGSGEGEGEVEGDDGAEEDIEVWIHKPGAPEDGLLFLQVPEHKSVKNRLHLDLRPDDQAAEVERLLALGATRVDVGQGDVSWVVLADPEGNELCVLKAREAR